MADLHLHINSTFGQREPFDLYARLEVVDSLLYLRTHGYTYLHACPMTSSYSSRTYSWNQMFLKVEFSTYPIPSGFQRGMGDENGPPCLQHFASPLAGLPRPGKGYIFFPSGCLHGRSILYRFSDAGGHRHPGLGPPCS